MQSRRSRRWPAALAGPAAGILRTREHSMAADYSTADQRGNPNSTWLPPDGSKMSGLQHFRAGRLSVSLRESASVSGLPHASWIPNSGAELTNRRSTRQTKAARRENSNPRASDFRAKRGRFASWSGWTLCWPSVLKSVSHIAAVQNRSKVCWFDRLSQKHSPKQKQWLVWQVAIAESDSDDL